MHAHLYCPLPVLLVELLPWALGPVLSRCCGRSLLSLMMPGSWEQPLPLNKVFPAFPNGPGSCQGPSIKPVIPPRSLPPLPFIARLPRGYSHLLPAFPHFHCAGLTPGGFTHSDNQWCLLFKSKACVLDSRHTWPLTSPLDAPSGVLMSRSSILCFP